MDQHADTDGFANNCAEGMPERGCSAKQTERRDAEQKIKKEKVTRKGKGKIKKQENICKSMKENNMAPSRAGPERSEVQFAKIKRVKIH